jgi:Na+-transporting NADH:ubiquinone oxidoreductase subunit B
MVQVIYALIPLAVASIYFFGWKALLLLAVVNAVGLLSEYLFVRLRNQKVTSAVFVTGFLFALSLPPTIPLWIAVVGIVFGVVFGKMVFGGFGRNIYNPALAGRAFIYVSFGVPMTARWVAPASGAWRGLAVFQADAVTQATPLVQLAEGEPVSLISLFLGNVSGSFGETSALLILIGGIYLMVRKVASYRIVVSSAAGFLLPQILFWIAGIRGVPDPMSALLSGSLLYGIMFMATDPVSASQTTDTGRWIYGAIIGVLASLIRTFSAWPEGITFAILLANTFAPLLDYTIKQSRARRKARPK